MRQFVSEAGVELCRVGEVGPLALGARVHYVHGEDLELNRLLVSEDLDGAVTLGAVARQVLRERREHSAAGHVVPVNDDERAHGSLRTPGVDAGSAPCGFLAVGVVREIEVERFRPALYNRGIDGRARHAHLCDGRSQARVRASTSPEIWMSDRPPTFSLPPMTSMGTLSTPSASGGAPRPRKTKRAQQLRDGECARDEGHDAGHRPEQVGRHSRDRARDRGGGVPRPCNRGSSCRV